jgi:hypothetical protein
VTSWRVLLTDSKRMTKRQPLGWRFASEEWDG